MNVTIVLLKQVATMIRDNWQLCLKILRERFGTRSPFPPPSCSVSSRSSLAHLFSAGYPEIVDCSGQVAEVLDPTEPLPFDPQREEADLLQGNLLVFQFLAFTR
ncbi:hypothetical protein XENOCAPTIV_006647 [Xenoophorus captivus]|uniref:NPHP4 C2-like domain-containing protein n=1 Tax=Xenoophorus captivus TaxID=1517983 RepID=A0ABV0Q8E3_9TELE